MAAGSYGAVAVVREVCLFGEEATLRYTHGMMHQIASRGIGTHCALQFENTELYAIDNNSLSEVDACLHHAPLT